MKITKMLGCALAAVLLAFAAEKAQALVINNEVYSPLSLKISTKFNDGTNKVKSVSITQKDVLKILGDNAKGDMLVQASFAPYDIWVVNKDVLVRNLSTNGVLSLNYNALVSSSKKNSFTEYGVLEVVFNSDMTSDSFDITGVYTYSSNTGNIDKNGNFKFSEKLSAPNMSGTGFFPSLSGSDVPVTGSASYSGSGKDIAAN